MTKPKEEHITIKIKVLRGSAFQSKFIYNSLKAFLETMKGFTMSKNPVSKFTYDITRIRDTTGEE